MLNKEVEQVVSIIHLTGVPSALIIKFPYIFSEELIVMSLDSVQISVKVNKLFYLVRALARDILRRDNSQESHRYRPSSVDLKKKQTTFSLFFVKKKLQRQKNNAWRIIQINRLATIDLNQNVICTCFGTDFMPSYTPFFNSVHYHFSFGRFKKDDLFVWYHLENVSLVLVLISQTILAWLLSFTTLWTNSVNDKLMTFSLFSQKKGFDI